MKEGYNTPFSGRIEENSAGLGVPSLEEIEQRARELAVISGRSEQEVNQADRTQARLELLGEQSQDVEGQDAMVSAVTDWDEAPGTSGHRVSSTPSDDEPSIGEQLVEEGAAEALHDEMLEARKKNIDAAS